MAVPVFTSISPATGTAGGRNLVTITGSNFRLSSIISDSVKVEFDGIDALRVDVISETELQVMTPPYRGEDSAAKANPLATVAIKITNLDDDGNPIGGEDVTVNSAYRYTRSPVRPPRATRENQTFRQIVYEVIWTFQRQVVPNVAIGTSVDYGNLGEAFIREAKFPNVTLLGPRFEEDMESRHLWADLEEVDGELFWPGFVNTIEFDVVLGSNRRSEMYGMIQGLHSMFIRTPYLEVPININSPNDGYHKFPFMLTAGPGASIQEANSDVIMAPATLQVKRVPFRLDDPVEALYEILEGEFRVFNNTDFSGSSEIFSFATTD